MGKTINKKITKMGGLPDIALIGIGAIALFSGLFFSAQAGIFILAGAWIVVLSWKYPKQAFWMLLLFSPLLPLLKTTQILSAVTPLKDFIILALFIKVVIYPIYRKNDPYRRNNILLPVLFICGYSLFAALRADSMILGALRFRDIMLYIPMLWIGRALIVTRKDLNDLMKVVFGGTALVLGLALVQFVFFGDGMVLRFDPTNDAWIPRASSTLAHPNILGSFLLCTVPFLFSFSLFNFKRGWKSGLTLLLGILGLIAAYATYSRGVWIAFAVASAAFGVVVLFQKKHLFFKVVFPIFFIVAISLFAVPRTRNLLRTVVDPTYQSNEDRIGIVASLVSGITNTEALIGRGLGDVYQSTGRNINISITDIAANNVQTVQIAKAQTFVDNAIAKTFIETGLAGLLIVGWLVWNVISNSWPSVVRGRKNEEKYFAAGLLATTVGLLSLSLFLDVPETFPVALLWWTLVGVGQAIPYLKESPTKQF